ncbi:MAG: helix-turn-helix domain-containing protein [Endomicrobium sp.]|nr:helix-turn-helix domain-containing protein [Endomicrobium sp.]
MQITVGKKIKAAMQEVELTQKQLAKKIGSAQEVISRWINGEAIPKIDSLEKIAEATGKDVSYFISSERHGNVRDVKGNHNIVGRNTVDCHEALDMAKKYIKKLEEEVEQLKKNKKTYAPDDWRQR